MNLSAPIRLANALLTRSAGRWTALGCVARLPSLLLLLTVPAAGQSKDFTYTTNSGTITITGYTGPGGAVAIPSTINGLLITRIGDAAFQYNSSVTSVTIGNSVTTIGVGAFSGTGLTSFTIPNSVTFIGDWAFYYCDSLTAITVDALNSAYSSVDGILFNQSQTTLIQYPARKAGSYAIPNSVTNIGDVAFYHCTSLTSITIPDGVTTIGGDVPFGGAFFGCTSLTSVTIGNNVTSIKGYAFADCISLTSVTIPNSVTSIASGAFADCSNLASVTIGNSVTSIGARTFRNCTSLTSITIPDSVTSIGGSVFWGGAFFGCTSLTNITISNSITNIGYGAFYFCTNLTGVYFRGNAPSLDSIVFDGDNNAAVYYLPGTTGWGPTYSDRPTALWLLPNPLILKNGASFGVRTNRFGFIISWATNSSVVVQASSDLGNPIWTPVSTNTLTGGSSYFSDPQWTNHPARFYRLVSPVP